MIPINDDWVVDVDEYNYALKKDLHKEVPRKERDGSVTMVHQYKTCGYFSTLQHALNRLLDEMVVEILSDGEISLKEAVARIEKCAKEWRKLIKDITEVK